MAFVPAVDARVRVFTFADLRAATGGFRTKIGSGATGDVFSGTHDGVEVAVKRLNLPAGSSAEQRTQLRRRFLAELRALASMQHVRLVHLQGYAVDESDGAVHPYALVYELLDGGSLADWLKGVAGEPPLRRAAAPTPPAPAAAAAAAAAADPVRCMLTALERTEIALGIASGMAFLHGQEEPAEGGVGPAAADVGRGAAAAGGAGAAPVAARQVVLHRDIKAANIGLGVLAGGALHAKLLDFGLARAIRGDAVPAGAGAAAAAAGLSTTTGVMGTPGYMAPELANTGPSVQTDIYAFGMVLLELLSGQRVNAGVVARLLEDAEEAGPAAGSALIAAQAEPGVWPAEAVAALSQLTFACTRQFPRRRLAGIADAITRLRAIRTMVAPAVPLTAACDACMEEFPAAEIIACPAAAAAGAGAGAAAAAVSPHNVCLACLQRHVATVEAIAIDMNGGRIPCPTCTSPGWALDAITDRVDKPTHRTLTAKLARLADAARRKRAFECDLQDKIAHGLRAAGAGAAVGGVGAGTAAAASDIRARAAVLADVIRERDLTLRCPRCSVPYAEIDGCNAVLCGSRDAAAGVDLATFGCGARFCGVCCREFPTAAANHAHHKTAHGDYLDKSLLKRAQCESRARAAVLSLQSFAHGAGGAELQRATAAAVGDVVLAGVGFTVQMLLERAGVPPSLHSHAAAAGASLTAEAEAAEAANRSLAAALKGKLSMDASRALEAWIGADRGRAACVTRLDMRESRLFGDSFALVASSLPSLPRLQHLVLRGNSLGSAEAALLGARLEHVPRLQLLDMSTNTLGAGGAAALAACLAHVPLLQHLDVNYNNIGSHGLAAVAAGLARVPQLKHLDLGYNNIDAGGAAALAAALVRVPQLHCLNLGNNKLGDAGASALATGLAHTSQLQQLHLSFNAIGADEVTVMAVSTQEQKLASLSYKDVSDGVTSLAARLTDLPQLRLLCLKGNTVSDAGLRHLHTARDRDAPRCHLQQ